METARGHRSGLVVVYGPPVGPAFRELFDNAYAVPRAIEEIVRLLGTWIVLSSWERELRCIRTPQYQYR